MLALGAADLEGADFAAAFHTGHDGAFMTSAARTGKLATSGTIFLAYKGFVRFHDLAGTAKRGAQNRGSVP